MQQIEGLNEFLDETYGPLKVIDRQELEKIVEELDRFGQEDHERA